MKKLANLDSIKMRANVYFFAESSDNTNISDYVGYASSDGTTTQNSKWPTRRTQCFQVPCALVSYAVPMKIPYTFENLLYVISKGSVKLIRTLNTINID